MNIETARTVLRGFHLEDVDDLQEILGDEQVMEYLEPPYERDRTEEFDSVLRERMLWRLSIKSPGR